jgi:asparagine synthase (glutamine-hydrolysing)
VLSAIRAGDTAALAARAGSSPARCATGRPVRLARTIGVPLRYFVAKMYHGPFLVVSDRIDTMFEWCERQRIRLAVRPGIHADDSGALPGGTGSGGVPGPMPRYRRFFEPSIGQGPADVEETGAAYVRAASAALTAWMAAVPAGQPIAVAFSGGVDSTSVWLLARHVAAALGRNPDDVRAFTLDFGGGADAAQAADVARALGLEATWERVEVPEAQYDLLEAIRTIEDYHPLDVECAAASLCLLRGIRERHPSLRYLVDGDGGDENLKGLPARGLRPDAVEHLAQPAALPGRLGHRRHQAQPVLFRAACRAATSGPTRRRRATASRRSHPTRPATRSPRPSRCRSRPCSAATPRG